MRCVFCFKNNTEVVETRVLKNGDVVRRRRKCLDCGRRFTTYERVEKSPILVLKRDGKRERFDEVKLKEGIIKAVEKTKVSGDDVERIVSEIAGKIRQSERAEVESREIGEMVAEELKKKDKIAYIRFASVFKRFVDLDDLQKEISKL